MTSTQRQGWGDENDSDDEELAPTSSVLSSGVGTGGVGGATGSAVQIPPTQKSRIDSQGIQIITSYRQNPTNSGQLLKTITKVKVTTVQVKEPRAVTERRQWKKFGQAALDEKQGTKTTVQSKDEILLEDPNADTDLQEDDPTAALGNLNAFWAKQQLKKLQRKYDVDGTGGGDEDPGAAAAPGWTQVGAGGATGKYVPPSARAGASMMAGSSSSAAGYKPERRNDDINTIRVTNLSESTTEADLQELFQRYGRISRVYLAKDKETMQSRGFAFVSFVSKEDAARAMEELQGYGYHHLILKLEWARPNAPKDPASSGTEFRSGYGKALAQDTKEKVSYASNLTK